MKALWAERVTTVGRDFITDRKCSLVEIRMKVNKFQKHQLVSAFQMHLKNVDPLRTEGAYWIKSGFRLQWKRQNRINFGRNSNLHQVQLKDALHNDSKICLATLIVLRLISLQQLMCYIMFIMPNDSPII